MDWAYVIGFLVYPPGSQGLSSLFSAGERHAKNPVTQHHAVDKLKRPAPPTLVGELHLPVLQIDSFPKRDISTAISSWHGFCHFLPTNVSAAGEWKKTKRGLIGGSLRPALYLVVCS